MRLTSIHNAPFPNIPRWVGRRGEAETRSAGTGRQATPKHHTLPASGEVMGGERTALKWWGGGNAKRGVEMIEMTNRCAEVGKSMRICNNPRKVAKCENGKCENGRKLPKAQCDDIERLGGGFCRILKQKNGLKLWGNPGKIKKK